MKRILVLLLLALPFVTLAQKPVVIDKIVGMVGDNIIMQSDVEQQYLFLLQQENLPDNPAMKCRVFEDLLFAKLLLAQAKLDSVEVSDKQVEDELDKRVDYYMNSPLFNGDVKKFEEYYGKPMSEIKDDFRKKIYEQMMGQQVMGKITAGVKVSPNDIARFLASVPKDSLPTVNTEVEIGQIVRKPVIPESEKKRIRDFLEDLRSQIKDSPTIFAAQALIHGTDGSRVKGGELGYLTRDQLVPEFAAVAFSLKDKNVSEIVESPFGFHIIQLIDRRGEQINVRHILITPEVTTADLLIAEKFLDSLKKEIDAGKITFAKAAELYSDDADTRRNGGMLINPQDNSTRIDLGDLSKFDNTLFYTIDKMNEGEISSPVVIKSQNGLDVAGHRLVYLKVRTKPHIINIKDDYPKLQMLTEQDKKKIAVNKWITEKRKSTYIKIDTDYLNCKFDNNWIN